MGRPRKTPKGIEARVIQLSDRPPIVDGKLLRSQFWITWSRIEAVPPDFWMRWPVETSIDQLGKVPVGQIQSWSEKLPRHSNWDFRGFIWIDGKWIKFRKCMPNHFLPRVADQRENAESFEVAFHSQPIWSVYADIPLREDIYLFIKLNLKLFFAVGKSQACLLMRDGKTSAVRDRLLAWEATHPYHISRLVTRRLRTKGGSRQSPGALFQRYTHAALRGIGLHWPDKPFARRAAWPDSLRSLGLNVQVLKTAATPSNSN